MDEQKKSSKTSLILWIFVVLIIVIGVIIYVVMTQNSDINANANTVGVTNQNTNATANTAADTNIDTSEWLTYENEEYEFSFRYPNDWTIEVFKYDPTATDALNQGGDRVVASDIDSNEKFIVCPDKRGPGCVVSHDPHEITQERPTQIDRRGAVVRSYRIANVVGCPECTRDIGTVKIVLDEIPSNWTQGEFMLVPLIDDTFDIARRVLDTFQFTNSNHSFEFD